MIVRKKIVKEIKQISLKCGLSPRTVFLALQYIDKIGSKIVSFDGIELISKFCLIIAAKFSENGEKAVSIEKTYKNEISTNYINDEVYILQLLNYELKLPTLYDSIISILQKGFIFDNESVTPKKLSYAYDAALQTLFHLIDNRIVIDLPMKQVVIAIIAFSRELVGLEAFSHVLIVSNSIEESELESYKEALRKVKQCFKLKRKSEEKCSDVNNISYSLS